MILTPEQALDSNQNGITPQQAARYLGNKLFGEEVELLPSVTELFELDNKYVSIANNKLKYERSNSKLGEYWVSFFQVAIPAGASNSG